MCIRDRGLILPPAIAPFQVVIVPIAAHKPGVSEKAEELAARISKFARVKPVSYTHLCGASPMWWATTAAAPLCCSICSS